MLEESESIFSPQGRYAGIKVSALHEYAGIAELCERDESLGCLRGVIEVSKREARWCQGLCVPVTCCFRRLS